MGRWSTGAITTGQCLRLHVSSFVREIKQGRSLTNGSISWNTGASITVNLFLNDLSATANLQYGKKDHEGNQQQINYNIPIISTPSNLGKGRIYYFVCPFSGKRCKVLYMGYGSLYFKSREAYRHRIYYPSQLSSRLDKHNDKYWSLERKLEGLRGKHPKTHYRGKPTKARQRLERMQRKQEYHEEMRWMVLPVAVMKSMKQHGLNDASKLF